MRLKKKVFYTVTVLVGIFIGGAINTAGYEAPPQHVNPRIASVPYEPSYVPEPYQTFDASEFIPYANPTASPTPEPTKKPKPKPKPNPVVRVIRYPRAPSVLAAQKYALSKIGRYQYNCLYILFNRESHWRTHAHNSSSGAYGIPQALPGSKMARFGDDWRDNPITQVRWGLWYIKNRYGTACNALQHSYRTGWY